MNFEVDQRIQTSAFFLGEWRLCSVYLKNESTFPWMILVPREDNVQEIHQLSETNHLQLMHEVVALSRIMQDIFKPDKLNIGALGNIVTQLHVHVVARFKTDTLWPHGIWQPNIEPVPYPSESISVLTQILAKQIRKSALRIEIS